MELRVQRWSSVADFLQAAHDFLAAHEAEHCLLFGIASTIASHPEIYPGPRFWTVHQADRVVAAALRTPPHNLLLSLIGDPRWLAVLADDVLASDEIPGVFGPAAAARTLADIWSARTGRTAVRLMQERIFRLDRVIPPAPAPGRCRQAEPGDRARLAGWLSAFHAEALPGIAAGDTAEAADRLVRRVSRIAYLWDHDGEVVSLAVVSGPTPHGIRIGPVYTPPDRRGRGYASNLVAEASRLQLASDRRFCFLFTNLANQTSNHIYQAIGYIPVVDVDQYRFPALPR